MFNNLNRNPFMMGEQDSFIDIDNNQGNIDIDVNQDQNFMNGNSMGCPIIEPMRERVVNRTIEHVVPHECPLMHNIKKIVEILVQERQKFFLFYAK